MSEEITLATLSASDGIPPYAYAKTGAGGGLIVRGDAVLISAGHPVRLQDSDIALTARAEDSGVRLGMLTVRAKIKGVAPLLNLPGVVLSELTILPDVESGEIVIERTAAPLSRDAVLTVGLNGVALSKDSGDLEFSGAPPTVYLPSGATLDGRALSIVIRGSDGEGTPEKRARPDRLYTVTVRAVRKIAAEMIAAGGDSIAGAITIVGGGGVRTYAASVSASGGFGNYTYAGLSVAGKTLEVNSSGEIYIPASVSPTQDGRTITFAVQTDDSGKGSPKTNPIQISLTLVYVDGSLPPLSLSMQVLGFVPEGESRIDGGAHYHLLNIPLAQRRLAAILHASGGTPPYTYSKTRGSLEVDGRMIYIPAGDVASVENIRADAYRFAEVLVSDSAPSPATTMTMPRAALVGVRSHGLLSGTRLNPRMQFADSSLVDFSMARTKGSSLPITLALVNRPLYTPNGSLTKEKGDLDFVDSPDSSLSQTPDSIVIPAGMEPNGQTLSIVLRATDGDNSDLERARPDMRYTIFFRYFRKISAAVIAYDGTEAQGEIRMQHTGNASLYVARIAASGAEHYSYAGISVAGKTLHVNSSGAIYIPATVSPLAGDGLTMTFAVDVEGTGRDADLTRKTRVQLTAVYVLGAPRPLAARAFRLSHLIPPTAPEQPYYIMEIRQEDDIFVGLNSALNTRLAERAPLAGFALSGGTPPYSYALRGADGTGLEMDGGTVYMSAGNVPEFNAKFLTAEGTDSASPPAKISAQFVARTLPRQPVGELEGDAPDGGGVLHRELLNGGRTLAIARSGASSLPLVVAVNLRANLASDGLTKTDGDLIYDSIARSLSIPAGTSPNSQTLSVVLTGSDGDESLEARLRKDRPFTVYVRYYPEIAAAMKTAGGETISKPLTITHEGGVSVFVASVSASGGVGNYSYAGISVAGQTLHLDSNGVVYIPATLSPLVGDGKTMTFAVDVNDSGDGDVATGATRISLTLVYLAASSSLRLEAKDLDGDVIPGGNLSKQATTYFFHKNFRGDEAAPIPLSEVITLATLSASEGIPPYAYAKMGAGGAMIVRDDAILIPAGHPVRLQNSNIIMTARAEDSGGRLGRLTVRAKIRGVKPHGNLAGYRTFPSRRGFIDLESENFVMARAAASRSSEFIIALFDLPVGWISKERGDLEFSHRLLVRAPWIAIPANTTPGTTLSIVLRATDGDRTPQNRARPDRLYTVFVHYAKNIAAGFRTAGGEAVSEPITIAHAGGASVFVASVSASGGVGNYSYTGISVAGQTLHLDSDGAVYIPATLSPLAGEGRTMTFAVDVNDSGEGAEAADATRISLTLVYAYESPPLILEARNLKGEVVPGGDFRRRATTYFFHQGFSVTTISQSPREAITLATLSAREGIPPYTYTKTGAGGGLIVRDGVVLISEDNGVFLHDSELALTARAEDSGGRFGLLTVRAKIKGVRPHGELLGTVIPSSDAVTLDAATLAVERTRSSKSRIKIIDIDMSDGLGSPLFKEKGELELTRFNHKGFGSIYLPARANPDGRTLSIVIRADDGDNNEEERARPNRRYTVFVRYFPKMEAVVKTADDKTAAGKIKIAGPGNASVFVASVSASGGVGNYTYAGISVAGETLHVDSNGVVFIPATLSPPTSEAMTVTFAVAVNDSGNDANLTRETRVQLTAVYRLGRFAPLSLSMQLLGMAAEGEWAEKGGVHYHLSETPLAERRAAAILHVSGGIPPYAYSRTSGDLEVDGSTVYLPEGIMTRIRSVGGLGYLFANVLVKDSAPSAATIAAKPGALFVGVDRHGGFTDFNQPSYLVRARTSSEPITLTRILLPHKTLEGELTKVKGEMDLRDIPDPAYSDNNFYHLPRYPIFIPAGTEPSGQTLSIVLRASDGDNNARERTRPDRLYTISVRLMRAISAELRTKSGGRVQGAITIRRATNASVFVASVSASGGVGNYTYAGISGAGENLHVDSNGVIFIPSTLSPLAGDGKTVTFAVRTNDRGKDDGRTSSRKVSLTLVYVSGADLLQVQASDAEGNVIPDGDVFAAKGTIRVYIPAGGAPEDITLAAMSASGGTPPYNFRAELADANLSGLEFRNGAVVLPAGSSWNESSSALIVHAEDSGGRAGRLTVRANIKGVFSHGALEGFIFNPRTRVTLEGEEIAVKRVATTHLYRTVAELIPLPGAEISKEKGDLEFTSPNILIRSNTPPDGRKLSIVLRATDGDDNALERIRPDRRYTVAVRYFREFAAALKTESGGRFSGALTVRRLNKASVFVASVSASGGVGSYSHTGISVAGETLHVDSNGVIFIPASLSPRAGDGKTITFAVDAADSGEGAADVEAIRLSITLVYILAPPPLRMEARDLEGNAAPEGDLRNQATAYFYHKNFADTESSQALSEPLTLATLSASLGTPPYAYAKAGAGGGGLIARDGFVLASAGHSAGFAASDVVVTARAEDSAGRLGSVTVRAKIKGVAPHENLTGFRGDARLTIANVEAMNMINDNGAVFVNNPAGATLSKESGGLVFRPSPTSAEIPLISVPHSAPEGSTLSLVLRATDGDSTAEKRARPDRLYTIAARVVADNIRVETRRAGGAPFGAHEKVVGAGGVSVFVASIAAFGGAGNYTYTGRSAAGESTLHVDSNGVVYIPATVSPLPGAGRTIGITLDVDDSGEGSGLTRKVRVNLRAAYVMGAADALAAHVFNFNRHRSAPLASPDMPYYKIQMTQQAGDISGEMTFADALPARLAERTPLAAMTLSGGTPPYAYAMSGAEGTKLELDGGTLYMGAGDVPNYDAAGLIISGTDSASPPATIAITFDSLSRLQQPIGELQGDAPNGGALPREILNGSRTLAVVSPGALPIPRTVAVSLRADLADRGIIGNSSRDRGLFFNSSSNALMIPTGTVPIGHASSIVLQATDGDDSEERRLRQDRTYTVHVRYIPEISAAMNEATGGALVKPVAVLPSGSANMIVGRVSAAGGVGNYTYAGVSAAGATLHVNSSGAISIPGSLAARARPGMRITFAVEVNDSGADASTTSPVRVSLTVVYLSGGTLQVAVRDLRGESYTDGRFLKQTVHVFSKRLTEWSRRTPLPEEVLAATLTASGGTPPYTYVKLGETRERNLLLRDGAVLISAGNWVYDANIFSEMTVWAFDGAGDSGLQTVRVIIRGVPWHTDLSGRIPGGGAANFDDVITVSQPGVSSSMITAVQNIQVQKRTRPGSPSLLAAVRGNLILRGRPGGYRLLIPAHANPDGRTLSIVIRATDGDNNAADQARPDRLYTVFVRHLRRMSPGISAAMRTSSGRARVGPVQFRYPARTGRIVGRVSASGGVGNYTYAGISVAGATLHVNSSGVISIPEGLTTLSRPGTLLTFAVEVDDSGAGSSNTIPARVSLTLGLFASGTLQLQLEARDVRGNLVPGGNFWEQTLYLFSENFNRRTRRVPLSEDLLVATLTASGGTPPYTYAKIARGSEPDGLLESGGLLLRGREVLMSAGHWLHEYSDYATMTVWVIGSEGIEDKIEVEFPFQGVARHSDLEGRIPGGGAANFGDIITVSRREASSSPVLAVQNIYVRNGFQRGNGASRLSAVRGNLILHGRLGHYELSIPANTEPDGQMLSIVLRATDGDNTEENRVRPDRLYTVFVHYLRSPARHGTAPSYSASPRAIVRPASESDLFSYEPPPPLSSHRLLSESRKPPPVRLYSGRQTPTRPIISPRKDILFRELIL